ncbi:hypothetical protein HZQ94_05785 [Elizabethkingia anophelis]|nr:hypothetical protein [Elizabethkingia anophelis]MCT3680812.1 hypothetical protein [Elizabethkingia anophelis]
MDRKTLKSKDKGSRKGWPTIEKAKHVKLSDAKKINVYNPITKNNTSLSW